MKYLAAVLAAAIAFLAGMAFNEYLRGVPPPLATIHERDATWYFEPDPRTAELATGGGQEGAK